jgi:TusA-related sulfurtransferase
MQDESLMTDWILCKIDRALKQAEEGKVLEIKVRKNSSLCLVYDIPN